VCKKTQKVRKKCAKKLGKNAQKKRKKIRKKCAKKLGKNAQKN
jgi:hypothetical protein